jgi:hypothetical protein
VVAFVVSFAIAIAGIAAVVLYGRRRPVGAPVTWGEAIVAANFAFFLMFWAYGVVPHQWLTFANNEWQWTPTKGLVGPGGVLEDALPFTLDYEKLRDLVVVVIYGIFLVAHVWLWAWWQDRAKARPAEIETSTYGRPLVRRG